MSAREAIFQCRIVLSDDDDINPVHLCEEIQAYLNSSTDYLEENTDEYANAKVIGYNFKYDKFTPFIAQEEY